MKDSHLLDSIILKEAEMLEIIYSIFITEIKFNGIPPLKKNNNMALR